MSQEQKKQQPSTVQLTELNQEKHRDYTAKQKERIIARGNPPVDNNVIKGYN